MKKNIILFCFVPLLSLPFSGYSQEEDPVNAAILGLLQDENVNQFIEDSLIAGSRETITISELDNLADLEIVETLREHGLDLLYFPFIEMNTGNRDSINIINLDQIDSEYEMVNRLTNDTVLLAQIMVHLTVMYKTETHAFDEYATFDVPRYDAELYPQSRMVNIALEGRWLPWRRCYCTRNNRYLQTDGTWAVGSQGSCLMYRQEPDRCAGRCDRTGFLDQECSGDGCPSC